MSRLCSNQRKERVAEHAENLLYKLSVVVWSEKPLRRDYFHFGLFAFVDELINDSMIRLVHELKTSQ